MKNLMCTDCSINSAHPIFNSDLEMKEHRASAHGGPKMEDRDLSGAVSPSLIKAIDARFAVLEEKVETLEMLFPKINIDY